MIYVVKTIELSFFFFSLFLFLFVANIELSGSINELVLAFWSSHWPLTYNLFLYPVGLLKIDKISILLFLSLMTSEFLLYTYKCLVKVLPFESMKRFCSSLLLSLIFYPVKSFFLESTPSSC